VPQSPFTGIFYIKTFGIAFYQSNLSTSVLDMYCYTQRRKTKSGEKDAVTVEVCMGVLGAK
jgi:hypothetical protein